MTTGITHFHGSGHPTIFCGRLDSSHCYLKYYNLKDDKEVRFAKENLISKAKARWYMAECDELKRRRIFYTSEEMREKLLLKYIEENTIPKARDNSL